MRLYVPHRDQCHLQGLPRTSRRKSRARQRLRVRLRSVPAACGRRISLGSAHAVFLAVHRWRAGVVANATMGLPAAVATPVMAPEPKPAATSAVPATAAAAPTATADSDAVAEEESTELDEGDHVAIAHDDADFDQFKYYLLRVGKAPPGGWPETLGRNHGEEDFAEGDRVVRGVLLEPVSSNPGPGVYEPSEAVVITHVENVVVNLASELPRVLAWPTGRVRHRRRSRRARRPSRRRRTTACSG